MGNRVLARFGKLQWKISIVDVYFIEVVGQKSDAVINMELFLKVFLKLLKWSTAISQRKLKNKSLWYMFVRLCGLSFPSNPSGKSNISYLIGENFVEESDEFFLKFRHSSRTRIFPNENYSQWKLSRWKTLPA